MQSIQTASPLCHLKALHKICHQKPPKLVQAPTAGTAVLVWAAISSPLGLMDVSHILSTHKHRQVWWAVLSVTLSAVRWAFEHFRKRYVASFHVHRITKLVRLEDITVGHLLQPPCSSRVILRTHCTGCVQMVFQRGRPQSLGNLFQCTIIHTVKNFCMFSRELPLLSAFFCLLPLVLLIGTTTASALLTPTLYILTHINVVPLSVISFRG